MKYSRHFINKTLTKVKDNQLKVSFNNLDEGRRIAFQNRSHVLKKSISEWCSQKPVLSGILCTFIISCMLIRSLLDVHWNNSDRLSIIFRMGLQIYDSPPPLPLCGFCFYHVLHSICFVVRKFENSASLIRWIVSDHLHIWQPFQMHNHHMKKSNPHESQSSFPNFLLREWTLWTGKFNDCTFQWLQAEVVIEPKKILWFKNNFQFRQKIKLKMNENEIWRKMPCAMCHVCMGICSRPLFQTT